MLQCEGTIGDCGRSLTLASMCFLCIYILIFENFKGACSPLAPSKSARGLNSGKSNPLFIIGIGIPILTFSLSLLKMETKDDVVSLALSEDTQVAIHQHGSVCILFSL